MNDYGVRRLKALLKGIGLPASSKSVVNLPPVALLLYGCAATTSDSSNMIVNDSEKRRIEALLNQFNGTPVWLARLDHRKSKALHSNVEADSVWVFPLPVPFSRDSLAPRTSKSVAGGRALPLTSLSCTSIRNAIQGIAPDEPPTMVEGASRQVSVNVYERDPAARNACIAHHGNRCKICHMTFCETYGASFDGFIHVHHLVPLSRIGRTYKVDPINDLIPVCPNCHAALHLSEEPADVDGLRKLLERRKKKADNLIEVEEAG